MFDVAKIRKVGCKKHPGPKFCRPVPSARTAARGLEQNLRSEGFVRKTRYHLDLVFANLLFGANFSFYVSLTRNYLDFQQIFML